MKKFLMAFVLVLSTCFIANAQTTWFKATSLSYRYVNDYGYWTKWSNWEKCDVKIKFEMDEDYIVIYSNKTQYYKVISVLDPPYDPSGVTLKYSVIDGEDDYGHIRLRVENNGNSQLYVDFNNVSWVYNVIRTN